MDTQRQALFYSRLTNVYFVKQKEIKVKGEKEQLTKCITKTAEVSIKLSAEEKNDERLLCRIRDVDLRAKEAHYHNCCRRAYAKDENRHSASPTSETSAILSAHREVFELLCEYVQENIIDQLKVERLTMLKERYLQYLLDVECSQ